MTHLGSGDILHVDPVVRPVRSGWLATTPPDHPLRVGVVGADESEARILFSEELREWAALREQPDPVLQEG